MTQLAFPRLLRLPAIGVVAAATFFAAGPAVAGAGQSFGPHVGGPNIDSGNWGGYAASGSSQEFTKISGSWTEPAAKCANSNQLTAPWIGLDGYGNETVEQTGVAVECTGTKVSYDAWYEMYPAAPVYFNTNVSANDTFDASVTYNGNGKYTLVMNDVTKGWKKTFHKTSDGDENASAEAVIEDPTGQYPDLVNGVTFTGITVNGHLFDYYSPTKLTSGGYVPGALSGGTFTIKKG
jgi:Peptidase A4 family